MFAVPGRYLLVATLLLACVAVPGCGGCRSAPDVDADDAQRPGDASDADLPDYRFGLYMTQPASADRIDTTVKPGHWIAASLEVEATRADFIGQLATGSLPLERLPIRQRTVRGAVLAKGQPKRLEFLFTYPVREAEPLQSPSGGAGHPLEVALLAANGRELMRESYPVVVMPTHQFALVVLTPTPERYAYLMGLDSIGSPPGEWMPRGMAAHYRVLRPRPGDEPLPVPGSALAWTHVACVLWDDLPPDALDAHQQQALIDWLHWGGQLIVSGPASLDRLANSFLAPYLPARSDGSWTLTSELAAAVNVASVRWEPTSLPVGPDGWSGVRLVPLDNARVLATTYEAPLLVERPVGRGRTVVSAIRLDDRGLVDWPQFDQWMNALLLRRPPREFYDAFGAPAARWAIGENLSTPADDYTGDERGQIPDAYRFDPRINSQVRFFSRDARRPELPEEDNAVWHWFGLRRDDLTYSMAHGGLYHRATGNLLNEPIGGPGVAGWDDGSAVARAAQRTLAEAAGIAIPSSEFVVRMLAAYLIVLVPLNWGLFRLLRRVEWAWLAVPVIALGFAVIVVRLAQLDVGFIRAENEVSIVEVHGAYRRAHVTRFNALYTSLATRYSATFDDPHAVVQPVSSLAEVRRGQRFTTVSYSSDEGAALEGFEVASNSIGILRSEQFVDLGGGVHLIESGAGAAQLWHVENHTPLVFEDARVVSPRGEAWIGRLGPGESATLDFLAVPARPANDARAAELEEAASTAAASTAAASAGFDVARLLAVAVRDRPVGEWRLVATSAERLEGMSISPRATQKQHRTVVVAHLRLAAWREPLPDLVPRWSVVTQPVDPLDSVDSLDALDEF